MSHEALIYGGLGAAGYFVGKKFIPPFIGAWTNPVVGVALVGVGIGVKVKAVTAFGIGVTLEGVLALAGF